MSLLLLFQGGPAAAVTPPTQQVGSSAGGMAYSREEGRMRREYEQWLKDEEAVIAFLISQLG